MSKQAQSYTNLFNSYTNLFNALDNVPADRKEKVIAAAAEYMQEIRTLQAAGATSAEIEAAGDAIYKKYA